MDAIKPRTENAIATMAVDSAYKVYRAMGPGLLASVYSAVLTHELEKRGLRVEREKPIPLIYDGIKLEIGFLLDLLVDDLVIVELKSIEVVAPVHYKKLVTYLRLSGKRLGLLINFGAPTFKEAVRRLVHGLPD